MIISTPVETNRSASPSYHDSSPHPGQSGSRSGIWEESTATVNNQATIKTDERPSQSESKEAGSGPEPPPPGYSRFRNHPFAPNTFEAPKWGAIFVHFLWCALSWPFLYGCTRWAQRESLGFARAIVALGCTVVGLCVGPSLLALSKALLEAAGMSIQLIAGTMIVTGWVSMGHRHQHDASTRSSRREVEEFLIQNRRSQLYFRHALVQR